MTGLGFAGARITTPDVNVSAMTDEKGDYEIGLPDLRVPLYVDAPGYFPTSGSRLKGVQK